MIWVGHVVPMGEMRNAYNILVVQPEEIICIDGKIL